MEGPSSGSSGIENELRAIRKLSVSWRLQADALIDPEHGALARNCGPERLENGVCGKDAQRTNRERLDLPQRLLADEGTS